MRDRVDWVREGGGGGEAFAVVLVGHGGDWSWDRGAERVQLVECGGVGRVWGPRGGVGVFEVVEAWQVIDSLKREFIRKSVPNFPHFWLQCTSEKAFKGLW